ncbi:MAG: PPC domain-containing protein [Anaerolineales bacterium]|nr:PPC domain-containing protein [Anaerolineales bacterium]
MSIKSLSLMLIVALLAIAVVPVASAQSCPDGLSAEDCELLDQSRAAMSDLDSFRISNYSINLQLSAAEGSFDFVVDGSGAVLLDPFAVDLTFEPASITVDGDVTEGNGAFRNIDGWIFLATEENGEPSWIGINLGGQNLGGELGMAGMPDVDLGSFMGLAGWSRGADIEVDGQQLAVFTIDFSAETFLTSPMVTELLTSLLIQVGGEDSMTPTIAAILVSSILEEFSSQLADQSTFRFTQYINPDDGLVYYVGLDVDMNLNFSFLQGFSEDLDSSLPADDISLSVAFGATLADHNGDINVSAPDEYEDVTDDVVSLFDEIASGSLLPDLGGNGNSGGGNVDSTAPEFDIAAGETADGVLTGDNEKDYYRVTASAGDTLQFAVRAVDSEGFLDTYLELYDADGSLLASNDDAFDAPVALELGSLDSYISYEFDSDGDYIIVVSSVFTVESEPYTLVVQN